jgi:hypothetical protein
MTDTTCIFRASPKIVHRLEYGDDNRVNVMVVLHVTNTSILFIWYNKNNIVCLIFVIEKECFCEMGTVQLVMQVNSK